MKDSSFRNFGEFKDRALGDVGIGGIGQGDRIVRTGGGDGLFRRSDRLVRGGQHIRTGNKIFIPGGAGGIINSGFRRRLLCPRVSFLVRGILCPDVRVLGFNNFGVGRDFGTVHHDLIFLWIGGGVPVGNEEDEAADSFDGKADDSGFFIISIRCEGILPPGRPEEDHLKIFNMDFVQVVQALGLFLVGHIRIVDEGDLNGHSVIRVIRISVIVQDLGRGGILEERIGDEIQIHPAGFEPEGVGSALKIERDILLIDLAHMQRGMLGQRLFGGIIIPDSVALIKCGQARQFLNWGGNLALGDRHGIRLGSCRGILGILGILIILSFSRNLSRGYGRGFARIFDRCFRRNFGLRRRLVRIVRQGVRLRGGFDRRFFRRSVLITGLIRYLGLVVTLGRVRRRSGKNRRS